MQKKTGRRSQLAALAMVVPLFALLARGDVDRDLSVQKGAGPLPAGQIHLIGQAYVPSIYARTDSSGGREYSTRVRLANVSSARTVLVRLRMFDMQGNLVIDDGTSTGGSLTSGSVGPGYTEPASGFTASFEMTPKMASWLLFDRTDDWLQGWVEIEYEYLDGGPGPKVLIGDYNHKRNWSSPLLWSRFGGTLNGGMPF